MARVSQEDRVLAYLKQGHNITQKDAISLFGAYRLSAIIYTLRRKGVPILSRTLEEKNRYGDVVRFSQYYIGGVEVF